MEKCTDLLNGYLKGKRNVSKVVFKIIGTIFRGVNKDRFTLEQAIAKLYEK